MVSIMRPNLAVNTDAPSAALRGRRLPSSVRPQRGQTKEGHNIKLVLSAIVCLLATGCATMFRGIEQNVSVNTSPSGANIEFSNGQSCQSPCTIRTQRDKSLQITISKEGCETLKATMIPVLEFDGWFLGGLIDYGTGAVYSLRPNPLTVALLCERREAN